MGLLYLILGNICSNVADVAWFGADAHKAIGSVVNTVTGMTMGWVGYWFWNVFLPTKGKA